MIRTAESKQVRMEDLPALAHRLHLEDRKIVTTNGCFDLLHWGHLKYLQDARALGDLLICGVNADSSVKGLKGEGRPLVAEGLRALQLAALESVDYVVIFSEPTPNRFLELIGPAIHVKGGDYLEKALPEREVVEKGGGKVVCLPFVPGLSTSGLIEKIKHG